MSLTPYYADDSVSLYHGRIEDVLPQIREEVDLIMADPPYGETALAWDHWPVGWPSLAAQSAASLWCFGSMRMFLDRRDEFMAWRLSQDVVWRKSTAGFNPGDRFNRVHEHALHWYRGEWRGLHHAPERVTAVRRRNGDEIPRRAVAAGINGDRGASLSAVRREGLPRLCPRRSGRPDWPQSDREAARHPRATDHLRLPTRRAHPRPVRRVMLGQCRRARARPPVDRHRDARGTVRAGRAQTRPGRPPARGDAMTTTQSLAESCGITAPEVLKAVPGLTYRQLDYWTRTGRLRASEAVTGTDVEMPKEAPEALRLLAEGHTLSNVSRLTGLSRHTVEGLRDGRRPHRRSVAVDDPSTPGSGSSRLYAPAEVEVARRMLQLLRVGFEFPTAARIARETLSSGQREVDLGEGVRLTFLDPEVEAARREIKALLSAAGAEVAS